VLPEPRPWESPVDGGELLDAIADRLRTHVVMPGESCAAAALWCVLTYLTNAVDCLPILAVTSPTKRCGKTVLLDLLAGLVNRPLPASNITPAALFRVVEKWQPTLLIDEADTFLRSSDELRGILNSGHTRHTAFVVRVEGDEHEPMRFSTWGCKAIALIGRLPDTLADRSVEIRMQRKTPRERVERLTRHVREKVLPVLARKAARFAQDIIDTVIDSDPRVPDTLNDRQADNWRPLLAIADAAGGDWPDFARQAAVCLSAQADPDSRNVELLRDIKAVFDAENASFPTTAHLIDRLAEIEESPWGDWRNGRPITAQALSRLLRPFGVLPKHTKGGNGYTTADLAAVWERYLGPEQTQPQPATSRAPATEQWIKL